MKKRYQSNTMHDNTTMIHFETGHISIYDRGYVMDGYITVFIIVIMILKHCD